MTGYGVGFEIYIMTETPTEEAIGFSGVVRLDDGEVYWCSRNSHRKAKRQYIPQPLSGVDRDRPVARPN